MIKAKVSFVVIVILIVINLGIDCYHISPRNRLCTAIRSSTWNDFYNGNIISLTTDISELPASNITTTEWSVYLDLHKTLKDEKAALIMKHLIEQKENHEKKTMTIKIDKGTSNGIDTLNELYNLNGNYEYHLNIFRRNIALRANRVLHPANNAQTFSTLINLMISNNEWEFGCQVLEYIGLTPVTYCTFDGNVYLIDINAITNYIARYLLELRIEVIADKRAGAILEAANNEKERRDKESVQEWFYTQVHRSDLNFRTSDCILAVCRLALRYATKHASKDSQIVIKMNNIDQVMLDAGLPLDSNFLQRAKLLLTNDIQKLIPLSYENKVSIPKIEFIL
jgi:hypothetical protein